MNLYEETIKRELEHWDKKIKKKPSIINKFSKSMQSKTQSLIPKKVQDFLTIAIKGMVETIINGSSFFTDTKIKENLSLAESDSLVEKTFSIYHKTAIAQGIGFGAGGIILGLADFPALLTIKIKFLFDCAKLYGYDVNDEKERLYMLYIFQLAFSSDEYKLKIYDIIINFDSMKIEDINWEKLQTEYRDYIDLAKLMQLLPVVGALAGGIANHNLLLKLKATAMNCYRTRYFFS